MPAGDQANVGAGAARDGSGAGAATSLRLPVTGIEAELALVVDGERGDPLRYWASPAILMGPGAIDATGPVAPLPAGGLLYFDQGVLEVVTPVIELGPGATARVVRSVWEHIAHLRRRLTEWGAAHSQDVRLQGFSTHYNVTFDPPRAPDPSRTVEKLALLLSHILPLGVALTGGNRRSTGVGVRPRGNRIEVTTDFTPDPGLMIATATLVVGVVRGAMALPSYDLSVLADLAVPTVEGVVPGKHSSRTGWLVRDYHFPRSPFIANVDARLWPVRDGRRLSLRAIARETAWAFRRSLRQHSDPFSFRLLFSILEGRSPSLLELPDRPGAYEDVGGSCRWGDVLPQLRAHAVDRRWEVVGEAGWSTGSFEAFVASRGKARGRHRRRSAREAHRAGAERMRASASPPPTAGSLIRRRAAPARRAASEAYRGEDRRDDSAPGGPEQEPEVDRRLRPGLLERRIRGGGRAPVPFPDRHLVRSTYEQVFLRLVAGVRMRRDGHVYRPVRMRGWYHAVFEGEDGAERVLSIDELLSARVVWLDVPGGAEAVR